MQKSLGKNHPDIADSYSNIGIVYIEIGDYEKALEYSKKALSIRVQLLGENHINVSKSYTNIGTIYRIKGDYVKALDYCHKLFISEYYFKDIKIP